MGVAVVRVAGKPHITWINRLGLWDCTYGEIHGGGTTMHAAWLDYFCATHAEFMDRHHHVGWWLR